MGGHYVNWNHPLASCQIKLSGHDARSGGARALRKSEMGFTPRRTFSSLMARRCVGKKKKNAFKPGPKCLALSVNPPRNERSPSFASFACTTVQEACAKYGGGASSCTSKLLLLAGTNPPTHPRVDRRVQQLCLSFQRYKNCEQTRLILNMTAACHSCTSSPVFKMQYFAPSSPDANYPKFFHEVHATELLV